MFDLFFFFFSAAGELLLLHFMISLNTISASE